jgi:hypothetical protein
MSNENRPKLIDWLWPHFQADFTKARNLGSIIGTILSLLFVFLIAGFIAALINFILAAFQLGPYHGQQTHEAIRNIGLVLAAVIGAPFIAWRSFVAQRQADIAEQGLITDRINKAVQGLGADKAVKRHRMNQRGIFLYENGSDGEPDLKKPIFDELTLPNLEMRIGSVYALERVANESAADRPQILEILCAYVSNNFDTPGTFPHPSLETYDKVEPDPGLDKRFRGGAEGLGRDWASKLKKPRPDTLAAISVILRISKRFDKDAHNQPLTFSGANLQQADLGGANLVGARFENCQLDGANLEKADLSDVEFASCSLIGASINGAELIGTQFKKSRLECVNAGSIKNMSGCLFWDCDCSGAMFDEADLSNCDFDYVTARKTSFRAKKMNRTSFSNCDIRDGDISAHSMWQLKISGTWVPETGVQLTERVQLSEHAVASRMAMKVRLFADPKLPHHSFSSNLTGLMFGMKEVDQGDVKVFDPEVEGAAI